MTHAAPHVMLLTGGRYHDFAAFVATFAPLLRADEPSLTHTEDPRALLQLHQAEVDILVLYTCFNDPDGPSLLGAPTDALTAWVQAGGALLALHAATVMDPENQALFHLLGARFQSHPPPFAYTVTPLARPHPITAGIPAFSVVDEFYLQAYTSDIQIHLTATDRGVSHPVLWTRSAGAGRVAGLSLGHDAQTWSLPSYQKLICQALLWLHEKDNLR